MQLNEWSILMQFPINNNKLITRIGKRFNANPNTSTNSFSFINFMEVIKWAIKIVILLIYWFSVQAHVQVLKRHVLLVTVGGHDLWTSIRSIFFILERLHISFNHLIYELAIIATYVELKSLRLNPMGGRFSLSTDGILAGLKSGKKWIIRINWKKKSIMQSELISRLYPIIEESSSRFDSF